MSIDPGILQRVVDAPSEGVQVELKTWMDPKTEPAREKIVRAVAALYNHDGGYLVFGIDNRSRVAADGAPADAEKLFNEDDLQMLISRHLALPAPVTLRFVERDGVRHPVIIVPSGVRTPAVVRKPIGGTRTDSVFVRTLRTNGSVSTALAQAGDWPDLMQRCFDNREADIGTFIRRHLADIGPAFLKRMTTEYISPPDLKAVTAAVMAAGAKRFASACMEHDPSGFDQAWGASETAMQIWPSRDEQVADKTFRQTLAAADPRYGGMALWWDAGAMGPPASPVVRQSAWESWVVGDGNWQIFDFMRAAPTGAFYQRRVHPIDSVARRTGATPGLGFDPGIAVQDVAEAMAVGLRYATALGWPVDQSVLGFEFRWTGLKGRGLTSLSGGFRPSFDRAMEDRASSFVELPLSTAPLAVVSYAHRVVSPLIALFGGEVLSADFVEHAVKARLQRRG